jgi:hypothetical protein
VRKKVLRKKGKKDGETRTNWHGALSGVPVSRVSKAQRFNFHLRGASCISTVGGGGWVGAGGVGKRGGPGALGGGGGEGEDFRPDVVDSYFRGIPDIPDIPDTGQTGHTGHTGNFRPDVVDSHCWIKVGSRAQVEEGGVDGGGAGGGGCVLAGRWWLKAGVGGRCVALATH